MHFKRPLWLLLLSSLIVVTLLLFAARQFFAPYRHLDILIVNGTIVDGTERAPYMGDVAVRDGHIVGISRWRFYFSEAAFHIDAKGKIVAPGFIDVHTHVEPNLPATGAFQPANFLRQGVTTIITGNCGRSRTDIAALFKNLDRNGTYINVATLVGHNSVRQEAMGNASRPPTPAELTRMKSIVERAMQNGALGLSTGLAYTPGRFADKQEIVALAEVAAKEDGLYVSHIRDEGRGGMAAVQEALDIGASARAATHISHFKCSGPTEWHTVSKRLNLLETARETGRKVTIDMYPYTRSSTTTDILLPDWALKDGRAGLREVARNQSARERLHADIFAALQQEGWKDLTHVRLAAGRAGWIGRTLAEVPIASNSIDRQIENLIDISLLGGAQAIYADMNEEDVNQVAEDPFCVFGSDSAVRDQDLRYKPHPRGSGTFPRIIKYYVRDAQTLTLTQAIYKATGQAADIFHLKDRGYLRSGAWADIVIFDFEKIADGADYDHPFVSPSGIEYVIVNGNVAVDHNNLTISNPSGKAVKGVEK